jgi:pyruvate dehydrogenase E2 component (dihydrolipoamide acetyltransferase)
MAHEIVMPQLGLSMDSGQIITWLKKDGDQIKPGDLLLEVESDKSTVEVEAVESGILHIIRGPDDGSIAVGVVIAYLLTEGEQPPEIEAGETAKPIETPSPLPQSDAPGESKAVPQQTNGRRLPSTPAARRRAKELGVDWRLATPTGPGNAVRERDVILLASTLEEPSRPPAPAIQRAPLAQRLAEATGVNLVDLARRYPDRRIERQDVEAYIRERLQMAASGTPAPAPASAPRREKLGRLRKIIADRMAHSSRTYAPVTLTTEVDATALVEVRNGFKADQQTTIVPGYNTLLARLIAKALQEHPDVNASLEEDEIVYWNTVNVGVAVDTDRGLVVPVFRDVQVKTINQLAAEMDDLLPRAKEGKALPDELTSSTFTITNLGVYDIDGFTPIINYPETAVLGVGRLVDKWVVLDGQPAIRTMLTLSLTFDHRLVDGAPAARFLQRIKQLIEQPYLWMV